MSPLNPVTDEELPSLLMENELLRHETTHLRAKLAGTEKAVRDANSRVRHLQSVVAGRSPAVSGAAAGAPADRSRNDIRWLLGRTDRSPAGWIFRRFTGFAELKRRYLGESK
jgi:hypothetical protein